MTLLRHLVLIAVTFALSSFAAHAQTSRATFPSDFDRYVRYGIYDRGSSKEEAFALPDTIAIAKSGKALPVGTRLVLGIWTNSELTGYFVMEKGVDWGLEVADDKKTGDWHFQQFDINGQVSRGAIAERCESCHQGQASNDFMFTLDQMRAYIP
ncbi:cytochrome P460 family protein [Allorhizobium pseudoryzae]|uniref:cytochrome P460 family protein n=1 Tax=Allorhizobium pseudoryzae TaxID=379684 RepID=UPI003D085524